MSSTSSIPAPLDSILHELPGLKIKLTHERRVRVDLAPDSLPTLLELLKGRLGYLHLSAISCVHWEKSAEFELVYHVWSHELKTMVSAHIFIAADPGRYVSVYDIHTPAGFFERDIHEMYGVHFEGAPNLNKFILTSWNGPPPMLKSFNTRQYVEDSFGWVDYKPGWLKDIEKTGGGLE
ncbi:MAG TPA: NADH-quinone oxidoreductase subunit C [Rhodobacteraceae bacterium]|nr:NADH-quinone oxidoreductase subunit C [Paracoccaceae bacterium]